MAQKPQQGGAKKVKKQVLLEFDEETHLALKRRAVDERTTMRAFITDLVLTALGKKEGGKK